MPNYSEYMRRFNRPWGTTDDGDTPHDTSDTSVTTTTASRGLIEAELHREEEQIRRRRLLQQHYQYFTIDRSWFSEESLTAMFKEQEPNRPLIKNYYIIF